MQKALKILTLIIVLGHEILIPFSYAENDEEPEKGIETVISNETDREESSDEENNNDSDIIDVSEENTNEENNNQETIITEIQQEIEEQDQRENNQEGNTKENEGEEKMETENPEKEENSELSTESENGNEIEINENNSFNKTEIPSTEEENNNEGGNEEINDINQDGENNIIESAREEGQQEGNENINGGGEKTEQNTSSNTIQDTEETNAEISEQEEDKRTEGNTSNNNEEDKTDQGNQTEQGKEEEDTSEQGGNPGEEISLPKLKNIKGLKKGTNENNALSIITTETGIIATIDVQDVTKDLVITESFFANEVHFIRNFTEGIPSSLILPFNYQANDFSGTFHVLEAINGREPIRSEPIKEIQANKAYFVIPTKTFSEITFHNVTLEPTIVQNNSHNEWELIGTYTKIKNYNSNSENVYSIAGQNKGEIAIGDFVRAILGAKWAATRAAIFYDENHELNYNNICEKLDICPLKKFVVSFESNGGTIIEPQNITDEDRVGKPQDPEKENEQFDNWYQEETFTNIFDFSTPITGDITLYAHWANENQILSRATLINGKEFNQIMRELAQSPSNNEEEKIRKIQRTSEIPTGITTKSISLNDGEIIAWFEEGIIYYYSQFPRINLNEDASYMFSYFTNLTDIDFSGRDSSNTKNIEGMFGECRNLTSINLTGFDTTNITNMNYLFRGDINLENINLASFNTENVESMEGMFANCEKLSSINLTNFNTSKVTNMEGMFADCKNITSYDLSNFDTGKVKNIAYLFKNNKNLTSIDLSNFDTTNVTDMEGLFAGCENLSTITLNQFNTSNVTNMAGMFADCINLNTIDVTSFDTSNVQDTRSMFRNNKKIEELDLTNFETTNLRKTDHMFKGNNNLKTIFASEHFTTNTITTSEEMFQGCTDLKGGNGTEYNDTKEDIHMAKIDTPTQQGYFTQNITIKFMDETTEIFHQIIGKDQKINRPEDPLKEGFRFINRYTNTGYQQIFDFSNTLSGDTNIYAKREEDHFEREVITIRNPNNPLSGYTIMDRNLGAENNNINSTGSYGYKFQWGNNYGFKDDCWSDGIDECSDLTSTNSKPVETNGAIRTNTYNHKGYYNNSFIVSNDAYGYDYWKDNQRHNGLRGGEEDTFDNNRGNNIVPENRKGPCPEGYHIPSTNERSEVIHYWIETYGTENNIKKQDNLYLFSGNTTNFQSFFKLPLAGTRNPENGEIRSQGIYGKYRTSTPFNGEDSNFVNSFFIQTQATNPHNKENRSAGLPIRCFKNTFDAPETITITFNAEENGGTTNTGRINVLIDTEINLSEYTANKENNATFIGWNKDKNATTGLQNLKANQTTTLYAIFSKEINVTFKANGNQLDNNKSEIEKSCTIFNKENSCSIMTPTITAPENTPIILGFNQSITGGETITIRENEALEIQGGEVYYAHTKKGKKILTAKWNPNGAILSSTGDLGCELPESYDGELQATTCTITAPTITAPNSTPTIIGFNLIATATNNHERYNKETNKLTLNNENDNKTRYAITMSNKKTLKATFNGNGAYLSSTGELSCTIPETYNGTTQGETCTIEAPIIFRNQRNIIGFNTQSTDTNNNENYNSITRQLTLNETNTDNIRYAITNKKVTTTFISNGNKIDNSTESILKTCNINNTEERCKITTPNISTENGNTPIIVGFTTNASGSSIANIGANQEIEVEENQTYYAQTTAPQKNLIAKWNANGADLSFNDDRNCIIEATYNGERQDQSCTILFTPTITRIGGSSIGFNTNANAKENQTNYNPITKTLTLTPQENNQIWYAISNKVATAIFDANGNKINNQTGIIEKNCNVFNTQTTCEITTPTITSNNITPIIIGFTTTSSGALTGVIGSNSTVNIKGGEKYYAQTMNSGYSFEINYQKGKGVTHITKDQEICTIQNTYNGTKPSGCNITIPSISCQEGYSNGKWKSNKGGEFNQESSIILFDTDNITGFTASCTDIIAPLCTLTETPTKNPISLKEGYQTGEFSFTCIDIGDGLQDNEIDQTSLNYNDQIVTVQKSTTTDIQNGKIFKFIYTAKASGSTTFNIKGNKITDKAGNQNKPSERTPFVIVDTTTPTIEITETNKNEWTQTKTITAQTDKGTLKMSIGTEENCNETWTGDFEEYQEKTFNSESDNSKFICYKAIDNIGNIAYKRSDKIEKIDTTKPIITFNQEYGDKANIHSVTVTITDNDSGLKSNEKIKYKRQKEKNCTTNENEYQRTEITPNTEGTKTAKTTITTTGLEDGEYYLCIFNNITDQANNKNEITRTAGTFKIDNTAPVITITQDHTSEWSTSKKISATIDDGILMMSMSSNTNCNETWTGNFEEYQEKTFNSESDNGKFICYKAIDNIGNIAYKISNKIEKIDTTKPTCTISTQPTKILISDIEGYQTGKIIFTCIDTGAGISTTGINNTSLFYNGNTISINNDEITNTEINQQKTYTFIYKTKNIGETTIKLKAEMIQDQAGNKNIETEESNNIIVDKTKPNCKITNNTSTWTNEPIKITVSFENEENPAHQGYSWDEITFTTGNSKTINENGTYQALVQDGAGNTGTCQINITNIDKEKPITKEIETTNNIKTKTQTTTLQCHDNNEITQYYWGTKENPNEEDFQNTNNTENKQEFSHSEVVEEAATYYFFCKDIAGNISDKKEKTFYSYTIHNMLDKLDGNENEYNEINYQTFSTGKYLATENDSFIVEELYEKNFPIETTYKGFSTISEEILSTGTQTTLERNTNYYFRFQRGKVNFEIKTNTGIANISYKINNAENDTNTTNNTNLNIKVGSTISIYATAQEGYLYNETDETNPKIWDNLLQDQIFDPKATPRQDLQYTIKYQDDNGNTIKNDVIVTGQTFNEIITIIPEEITGYITPNSQNIRITTHNEDVILQYPIRKDLKYTIRYEDSKGKTLKEPITIEKQTFGQKIIITPEKINGYQLPNNQEIIIDITNDDIVFIYTKSTRTSSGGIRKKNNSEEKVYQWAKDQKLTNKSYEKFNPSNNITRAEMAKVISLYATKFLHQEIQENKEDCKHFSDLHEAGGDLNTYIIQACQLGIMGVKPDGIHAKENFNPNNSITKKEIAVLVSRTFRGTQYATGKNRYQGHLQHLEDIDLMDNTNIDNPFTRFEIYQLLKNLYEMNKMKEKILKLQNDQRDKKKAT